MPRGFFDHHIVMADDALCITAKLNADRPLRGHKLPFRAHVTVRRSKQVLYATRLAAQAAQE